MKFSLSTILLIIGISNLSTCVTRKKNIANLYNYQLFDKNGEQVETLQQKLDFNKYDAFNTHRKFLVLFYHLIPYPLIKQNLAYLQKPSNDFNQINNKKLDFDLDLNRLYRRKRRIIKDYDTVNTNDNKIEITTTPKPKNEVEISTKNTDIKNTYEVIDLESDANEIDFNQIFKFYPIDKNAVKKGHGYLTFGRRYSFYVSTNPNFVTQESSKANENILAEPEDNKVTDVD